MSLIEVFAPMISRVLGDKYRDKTQRPKGPNEPDYAPFLPRFVAYMIDSAIVGIPTVTLATLLAGGAEQGSALGSTLSFVVYMVYTTVMEGSEKQATFGKGLFKIKVTDLNGRPLSYGKALGRNLAKILSTLICGIGYLLPIFTEKNQALHDLLAGTLLVIATPPKARPLVRPPLQSPPPKT